MSAAKHTLPERYEVTKDGRVLSVAPNTAQPSKPATKPMGRDPFGANKRRAQMSKPTPGPWRWNGPNQLWGGEREAEEILKAEDDRKPYGMHSALIEHHWDSGVAKANRDLIAAAPDLAFQLLAAANYIDALGGDSRSYRQAIARATGAAQ